MATGCSSWKLEAAASFVNWRQRPVENQYDGEFKIVKTYNANQMFENFQDQFLNYKFIKQMSASMKGVTLYVTEIFLSPSC